MWRLTRLIFHANHTQKTGVASTAYTSHHGRPSFPAWSASDPQHDVTNHVGNLGVMSARAVELRRKAAEGEHAREADAHAHAHEAAHTHHSDHRGAGRSPGRKTVASPFVNMNDAPTAAATSVTARATPSAIERLRGSKQRSEAGRGGEPRDAGTASPSSTGIRGTQRTSRHSGVQKEILLLYRHTLRETRRMRDDDTRRNLRRFIREEYTQHMDIPRKHITKIEWHINHAKRKLEELQAMSPTTRFSVRR